MCKKFPNTIEVDTSRFSALTCRLHENEIKFNKCFDKRLLIRVLNRINDKSFILCNSDSQLQSTNNLSLALSCTELQHMLKK